VTNKQTDKEHGTFSSTAGARPTIPTMLGMVIEEVRTIFALIGPQSIDHNPDKPMMPLLSFSPIRLFNPQKLHLLSGTYFKNHKAFCSMLFTQPRVFN